MRWTNRATFELWRSIVHDIGVHDDLADVIGEWRKSGSDFLEAFAEQLEDDFGGWQGWDRVDVDSRFNAMAVHTFLCRVDWLQVAQRLVEHADAGPWPKHCCIGSECWCRKPVRCWTKAAAADLPQVVAASQAEGSKAIPRLAQGGVPGRVDADILFATARTMSCLALKLAAEEFVRIREAALLRRARYWFEASRHEQDVPLRTVWRKGGEPIAHWLVGAVSEVGDCSLFEDRDFLACGAFVAGVYVGDEDRWARGTMEAMPVTCPKCRELLAECRNPS